MLLTSFIVAFKHKSHTKHHPLSRTGNRLQKKHLNSFAVVRAIQNWILIVLHAMIEINGFYKIKNRFALSTEAPANIGPRIKARHTLISVYSHKIKKLFQAESRPDNNERACWRVSMCFSNGKPKKKAKVLRSLFIDTQLIETQKKNKIRRNEIN